MIITYCPITTISKTQSFIADLLKPTYVCYIFVCKLPIMYFSDPTQN